MDNIATNVTANKMEDKVMNKSEIVRQYAKEHPMPDQDLCPEIVQYWSSKKDGIINQSNRSGIRLKNGVKYSSNDNKIYYAVRSYNYEGAYIKFIPELKMIEASHMYLSGGRFIEGETRDWWFSGRRTFAFLGDTVAYSPTGELLKISYREDGTYKEKVSEGRYYCPEFLKQLKRLDHNGCVHNNNAICEQIKAMGGKIDKDIYWHMGTLMAFYKNQWVSREKSELAKKVDSYDLSENGDYNLNSVPDGYNYAVTVQILDNEYLLFRKFSHRGKGYDYATGTYKEYVWEELHRVFIDKKGKPTIVQKSWRDPKWKISTANIHLWNDPQQYILGEEFISQWKPVMYLKDLIDFKNNNALEELVNTLRHPIIEQLAKAGYPNLAKEITYENKVAANLKSYFRVESERKLPLYKLLGVNKWLLKALEDVQPKRYYNSLRLLVARNIKLLYGKTDISNLDKETIDLLVNGLKDLSFNDIKEICGYDSWEYRHTYWIEITDEMRNFVMKLLRMSKKSGRDMCKMYIDTMRVYQRIENKPDVDLHRFEDPHGLEIIHDALVAIQTREYEERQARWDEERRMALEEKKKRFERLQKDRKERFNAESDNYIIRVPEELEEITKEGCDLHHCVGGYLETHAVGNTNIIFLRRKASPDTSFYTIEVNPNNTLIQIHGSHNKWLGNDPEAIPFVYKWLKDRNIKFDKGILLNLGAGYGRSRDQLDESWLTKEVI